MLFSLSPVVRASRAVGGPGGGVRCRRLGDVPISGLSGGDGARDVQLEVRIPGRALTHAGPHQCAVVVAHLSSQPFERAGHLFPEALRVGQVARAALRCAVVCALDVGDSAFDARLRVLAFDRQPDSVRDVLCPPRALHLVIGGEFSFAVRHRFVLASLRPTDGHGLVCSSVPAALT